MADGQTIAAQGGVLARKLARARGADFSFAPDLGAVFGAGFAGEAGADSPAAPPAQDPHLRAWRLALARAARDQLKMTAGFAQLAQTQVSLTEVLETPLQRALILMLQGPGEGMGLMVISGQMLAALVEILTLTHLSHDPPDAGDLRKPTRTDAAMAVEFVDAALAGFEGILAENNAIHGADWAAGYRYAAFIDDPRPLHLMLEEGTYQLLSAELVLEDGARRGDIWLALPAIEAVLPMPDFPSMDVLDTLPDTVQDDSFAADLAAHVQDLPVQLDAALAQISLPLERLLRLQVGEVLALPLANLDQIDLKGLDGRRMARARLGQNRGMRALRLTDVAFASASATPVPMSAQVQNMAQHPSKGGLPFGQSAGQGIDPFAPSMPTETGPITGPLDAVAPPFDLALDMDAGLPNAISD